MTSVSEAVRGRRSARAFLATALPRETVEELLTLAARAPSGGNLQPWQVIALTGEPLEALKAKVLAKVAAGEAYEPMEIQVYPSPLEEPWRSRRFESGEALYRSIGVGREDKAGRRAQFARNYNLFGAPVGLFFFVHRSFDRPQWAHLGMFIQTLMLLAEERGLGTCAQESWAAYSRTVSDICGQGEEMVLHCGVALGHPDTKHPINGWRTERAPLAEYARLEGF
jgi:nitroreductase